MLKKEIEDLKIHEVFTFTDSSKNETDVESNPKKQLNERVESVTDRVSIDSSRNEEANFEDSAEDIRAGRKEKEIISNVSPILKLTLSEKEQQNSEFNDEDFVQPKRCKVDDTGSEAIDDFDTNAVGTLNLLEACRQYCPDAPFVHMSTNKVH